MGRSRGTGIWSDGIKALREEGGGAAPRRPRPREEGRGRATACRPERGFSPGAKEPGTLILDFRPPGV